MKIINHKKILTLIVFVLFLLSSKTVLAADVYGYKLGGSAVIHCFASKLECTKDAKSKYIPESACVVINEVDIAIGCPSFIKKPTVDVTIANSAGYKNYYTVGSGNLATKSFFETLSECKTEHDKYVKAHPNATVSACENTETPAQQFTTLRETLDTFDNFDNTYTLLAPIPGLGETAPKNIGDYFNIILKIAIGLCAVLAVIMIVIGGIQYMGDESVFGKTEAKSQITKAILGLLIAIGSYALLNTIDPALLGKKGVNISQVSTEITRTSGGGYFGVEVGTANANKNITTYDTYLKSASTKYGVQCTLIKAFMYAESGGVNGKTSPAGAMGLLQLMPATFTDQGFDISKTMDPQTNINAGASYISKLKNNGCNGSTKSSVCDISNTQYLAASYNGGPGANKEAPACSGKTMWQCSSYSGYAETRIYAPRVEANLKKLIEKGWGC